MYFSDWLCHAVHALLAHVDWLTHNVPSDHQRKYPPRKYLKTLLLATHPKTPLHRYEYSRLARYESLSHEQVQREPAREEAGPVLEHVDSLPCPQRGPAGAHGDRQLGRRERRADVGRHVVRALGRVAIQARVLRHDPPEEIVQIAKNVRTLTRFT